jgi:F-type H+-transporting ATPase subunit b
MTVSSEFWSWLFKIANFAVLVAILVKFARKPLKDYLVNRHMAVKTRLDEADRLFNEADGLRHQYEDKLSKLDGEIEEFRKALVEEAQRERGKILEEAQVFAAKIKDQARLTYEQDIREATARIKEEIARLTMERAELLLKEKVGKQDHDRMVEEFIEQLRSVN